MMSVSKFAVALATALTIACGGSIASAASFTVKQQNASNVFKDASGQNAWQQSATVKLGGDQKSVGAGLFRLTALDRVAQGSVEDFTAFCIDLGGWLSLPAEYSHFSTDFTQGALTKIDRLLSNVAVTNAETAAATQLTLWEIVTDGQGADLLNLGTGGFRVVSSSAKTLAGKYVAALNDPSKWTTMTGGWTFIQTPDFTANNKTYGQDLVALDLKPVPLPAAGWLLLVGVAALGATARSRRTSAAPL